MKKNLKESDIEKELKRINEQNELLKNDILKRVEESKKANLEITIQQLKIILKNYGVTSLFEGLFHVFQDIDFLELIGLSKNFTKVMEVKKAIHLFYGRVKKLN